MDARGQLCVGHRPARQPAARLGSRRRPRRAGAVRDDRASRRSAARWPCSSRSRPSSSGTARAGIAVLEQAVRAAREAGALVLLDAKRGDIGSTMQGYAEAYLDQSSPLAVDAMTVSPYLGFESLRPALDTRGHARGRRLRAGTDLQPRGPAGAARATRRPARWPVRCSPPSPRRTPAPHPGLGRRGGRGQPDRCDEDLAVNGPMLAPGFGAQGGGRRRRTPDLRRRAPQRAASTSREVLSAGPDASALREAAQRARDVVSAAVSAAS